MILSISFFTYPKAFSSLPQKQTYNAEITMNDGRQTLKPKTADYLSRWENKSPDGKDSRTKTPVPTN